MPQSNEQNLSQQITQLAQAVKTFGELQQKFFDEQARKTASRFQRFEIGKDSRVTNDGGPFSASANLSQAINLTLYDDCIIVFKGIGAFTGSLPPYCFIFEDGPAGIAIVDVLNSATGTNLNFDEAQLNIGSGIPLPLTFNPITNAIGFRMNRPLGNFRFLLCNIPVASGAFVPVGFEEIHIFASKRV